LPGRRINLKQGAFGPGIFLDGVEEGRAFRLDPRGVVGASDAVPWLAIFGGGCRDRQAEYCRSGKPGDTRNFLHWLSSFDHEMAEINTPSGFRRRASAVRGGTRVMVAIADQRDVSMRLPS